LVWEGQERDAGEFNSGAGVAGVREGDILAGKYRVERVLGVGGMGVVVAAHHIQLDEKVALEFLLPEALGNAEAVARFAREARAAVKIKSEHVARVTDVRTLPNGAPYMVMEYLQGGDLDGWLKERGPLPVGQAVEFVLQACVAVADAHALGIIHRDLKPANLFCVRRSDGLLSIKVLDFGISKMTDVSGGGPAMAMTKTSAMMGTPLYMSPEQMRSSKDVGAQTDIWALGAILFELMAGRPAFLADSVMELAIKVNSDPTPAIRSFRPDVPEGLEAIICKCLEKDPRQRYGNVAILALALLPFGPHRAKGSVERISGIIQAAGLSTSALAAPVSPPVRQVDATQASAGTLPPVGRTTLGSKTGKTRALMAAVAGALLVAAVVGSMFALQRAPAQKDASQAAAAPPPSVVLSVPPPPASLAPQPPLIEPPPVALAPSTGVLAAPTMPKRKGPAGGPATPATTPAAVVATPPAPAPALPAAAGAARCDPPFYFDTNGNRIFKKECL
jgi:serine/threonine-protein kinase